MFGKRKKVDVPPPPPPPEPNPALQAKCGYVDAEGKFYATADEALAALRQKAVEKEIGAIIALQYAPYSFDTRYYAQLEQLKKAIHDWPAFVARIEKARAITIPVSSK